MKKICVVGSLNVDLTLTLPRFHQPGETIAANSLHIYPGGKGGNQAVAAGKLGQDVMMVGCLGQDDHGTFYRRVLSEANVNASNVVDVDTQTGTALIEVDTKGENRIAILAGANQCVTIPMVENALDAILNCDFILMQYEIATDVVTWVAEKAHAAGKTVILDPAPATIAPDKLFPCVDYITPNATELMQLTNMPTETAEEIQEAAKMLLKRGVGAVIAKLGSYGCMYIDDEQVIAVPGFQVECVDTTAAGDSFNAGFAAALSEGQSLRNALRFANAVGALSVTGAGAQAAMPSREATEQFLSKQS